LPDLPKHRADKLLKKVKEIVKAAAKDKKNNY
jgi:hypothetical protein